MSAWWRGGAAGGVKADTALAEQLIATAANALIKWSCPREVRFIDALPVDQGGEDRLSGVGGGGSSHRHNVSRFAGVFDQTS